LPSGKGGKGQRHLLTFIKESRSVEGVDDQIESGDPA